LYRATHNPAVKAIPGVRISALTFVLFSAVWLASGARQSACAQPATAEYKVKAAFLFHFAQLVEWPAGAFGAGGQSLNLCIFADEPHLRELQDTLEGKLVGTRVLHVLLLSSPQSAQGCNMLFLSSEEVRRQAVILKNLRGQPVLTVGESENFLSDGGMIQLHLEDDKVRFDINAGLADSSHLKISSRLLLLATSVTLIDGQGRGRPSGAY
jgi:hypothetical protein